MSKVSVIIPTYNGDKYLSDTIDSALRQTYSNFEIIIINDGSVDNTMNIALSYINKYPDKVKYYYQTNKGIPASRNKGIIEATGEYVTFLDHDDLFSDDFISESLKYLEINMLDLVIPKYYLKIMHSANGEIRTIIGEKENIPSDGHRLYSLLFQKYIGDIRMLVKKSCFIKVGLLDERFLYHDDLDIWIRFAKAGFKVGLIPNTKPLYSYRVHNDSLSKIMCERVEGLSDNYKLYIKHKNEAFNSDRCLRKIYSERLWILGRKIFYHTNNKLLAFKVLLESQICDLNLNRIIRSATSLVKHSMLTNINDISKKNIMFYEASSGFGGSSGALAILINHLDINKYKANLIIKHSGPQFDKIKNAEIIKLKHYSEPEKISNMLFAIYFVKNILPEAIKLYFIIRKKKIGCVHTNTSIRDGIPAIIASKFARIPCVCHFRGTRPLLRRERYFAHWVNKIIVLNKNVYEMFKHDVPEEKLAIIYDGIDISEFSMVMGGSLRTEFNIRSNPIVGMVGRVVKGKGYKEYILAAKKVLGKIADAKFLIVGDAKGESSEYFNEVKSLVKAEGLERNIIFTGWRNDAKTLIADFDVLVQAATTPEGFGLTVVEAMALKKPVVSTNVPGPSDIIIDGETGFLVPPGDTTLMADKISYLLEHSEIAMKMGERGRKRAEELFDIRKCVKNIERIYDVLKC